MAQQLTPLPGLVDYFATQFIRGPAYGAEGSFHIIASNEPSRAPEVPPGRLVTRLLDRFWYGRALHRHARRLLGVG